MIPLCVQLHILAHIFVCAECMPFFSNTCVVITLCLQECAIEHIVIEALCIGGSQEIYSSQDFHIFMIVHVQLRT